MAQQFTKSEWKAILNELDANPGNYGFPERIYGSVIIGSFNIRKLGAAKNRANLIWEFLVRVCHQFDLLAVQEVMDDLSGLNKLMKKIGPDFGMIVSDKTGTYPGDRGVGERLAFIFRWSVLHRGEVVSDITYDRSKISSILYDNLDLVNEAKKKYLKKVDEFKAGKLKEEPKFNLPVFLSFIRQPFCVSFKIVGHPGTEPYRFMAVNSHLIYGTSKDRKNEFEALINWLYDRVKEKDKAYYPNFILMGDLNLNYDNPDTDYKKVVKYLKSLDSNTDKSINIYFPLIDPHPSENEPYTSNVKMTERYDQIGFFFREKGLPTHLDNKKMGKQERGPDYGVFNFTELFCKAIKGKSFSNLSKTQKEKFIARYEHKISDHMPVWMRLPLSDK